MEKKESTANVKDSIKILFSNKYAITFSVIYFVYTLLVNISNAVVTYYFKYYVGSIGAQSYIALLTFISPILLIFLPKLISKYGTKKILVLGNLLMILSIVVRVLSFGNVPILMVAALINTIATIPVGFLNSIYIIETMEYSEWKNNVRIDALIGALGGVGVPLSLSSDWKTAA